MNDLTKIKDNWTETKGILKQKFTLLTDDDLLLLEGRQEELFGRLEVKLGKTQEEIRKLIYNL